MRVGLVVVVEGCLACCLVACGPARSVDRGSVIGTGGSGGATSSVRSGGRGGSAGGSGGTAGALGGGGADGAGGSGGTYAPPDAQLGSDAGGTGGGPGIEPGGTGGSGGAGGGGAGGATGGAGAAGGSGPPMPDAGPPDTVTAPPPDAPPTPSPDAAPAPTPGVPPPTTTCPPAPGAGEIIATFPMGMLVTDPVPGRGGTSWMVLSGTVSAAEGITGMLAGGAGPVRCGSADFLRFTGSATQARAPIIRAQFRNSVGGVHQYVDASAWTGIRLWLRSAGGGRARVKVVDRNTDSRGGVCTLCNDHFMLEMEVSADWQLFTVPFAALKQAGTGDAQPALATSAIWALEIVAPKTATFILDVDDISFIK